MRAPQESDASGRQRYQTRCFLGSTDGAEIARNEHYHEGSMPPHTLRVRSITVLREAHVTGDWLASRCGLTSGEIGQARQEGRRKTETGIMPKRVVYIRRRANSEEEWKRSTRAPWSLLTERSYLVALEPCWIKSNLEGSPCRRFYQARRQGLDIPSPSRLPKSLRKHAWPGKGSP